MRTDDSYDARVARTLAELGIPASYAVDRHMPSYAEARELVSVGMDIHGRDRQLAPHAAGRWVELRAAAHQDGIGLLLVSAFRSLEHQRQIFERKIRAGESLERILKVNAPPGYSEHHTGRAVDLTTPGCAPLAEEFETSAAFAWLDQHAHRFGFTMTYPRENRFGIAYEPWHWAVQEGATGGMDIRARRADITRLALDAIVNAANERLAPGGGVCGAIHRAAGPELAEACAALAPCPTGQARLTPGFRLPARYVIHAVGPYWKGGRSGEARLLASAYQAALDLAEAHALSSVAFPAISTGIFGYPLREATGIAVDTVRRFLEQAERVREVVFACFSDEVLEEYRRAGVTA